MTKKEKSKGGTVTGRFKNKLDKSIVEMDMASVEAKILVDLADPDSERTVIGCDLVLFENLKQDFRLSRVNNHHDVKAIKEFADHANIPLETAEDILSGKVFVEYGVAENSIIFKPKNTEQIDPSSVDAGLLEISHSSPLGATGD